MRPRGIPRGKLAHVHHAYHRGFNEAAGNTPRKTRIPRQSYPAVNWCFNEAAGNTPRKTYDAALDTELVLWTLQ